MGFAAVHPEAGRIDATLPDLGCGLTWGAVHKTRPRIALRCPGCEHGMHAKVSARKLRYFAHNPGRPADCAWLNESLEHHLLKLELATAIRAAGWHAQLEVGAPDGTWRADVLATSHDGTRRIAWEAQLSPITDDDIAGRTARYRAHGIEVCWVGMAPRALWIGVVPSIRVRDPHDDLHGDRRWSVVDGAAGFRYSTGAWRAVEDLALATFIRWVLQDKMVIHPVQRRLRRVWFGPGSGYAARHMMWTTPRSVAEETRYEVMRQRQDELKHRAEQHRLQEEQTRRRDEQRQREIHAEQRRIAQEAQRADDDARWEERQRQLAITAERQRQQREAAEQQLLRQQHREQQAAQQWWAQLSPAQVEELRTAVVLHVRKRDAAHIEFDSRGPTAEYGHGVAVLQRHPRHGVQVCAILRPSPASAHRLPRRLPVFMRNAGEARLITGTGGVHPGRVVHFDLPEGEQLSLM